MLLDEKILIKVSRKNIAHLHSKGYECNLGDNIEIKTCDINFGSHIVINVKCDVCGNEKKLLFQKYIKNIKNDNFYACSSKCAQEKVKKTNFNKFGKEYYTQTDSYKNQVKETSIEKYGVEHFTQNEKIIDKIKKTNIEKYGVDNPFKSEEIKEKIKNSNIEKYGVDNPFKSEEIKEKMRKIFIEKYGVDWSSKSQIVKEKMKSTNIEKYGVSCPLQIDWIKDKAKEAYLEKYGVSFGKINDSILQKIKDNKKKKWIDKVLENNKNINYLSIDDDKKNYRFYCDKGHEFEISFPLLVQRNNANTVLCTLCNPVTKHVSGLEGQLTDFIKDNYNGEIIENKKILFPYEIDIYLPENKLGFEFNGLYWHCEQNRESNYHLLKTEIAESLGIKLIQIYEDEWRFKQDIVKSRILNLLGKSEKLYARKCEIKEITDTKLVRNFLDNNHIQGFVGSEIKIGLFYENNLVSIMTFGQSRRALGQRNVEGTYEMLRFCNKLNLTVIGGASRLLNYFIKYYKPLKIISYADRSWSSGELYKNLGFNLLGKTPPNYYYIIDKLYRKHRFNFRKDKLIREGADPNKTEHEIMLEKKLFRIYDSGSLKFSKEI